MKPLSSLIETSPATGVTPTGTPPGGLGAGTGKATAPVRFQEAPAVAARLAEATPAEARNAVSASLKRCGVNASVAILMGGRVAVKLTPVDGIPPDFSKAAAQAEMLLACPSEDAVKEWLAELDAMTAKKSGSEFDGALTLKAYARRLAGFPADLVRFELLEQRRKWFPTLAEIEDAIEPETIRRRALADKLADLAARPKAQPEPVDPREAALRRVEAKLDRLDRRDELAALSRSLRAPTAPTTGDGPLARPAPAPETDPGAPEDLIAARMAQIEAWKREAGE